MGRDLSFASLVADASPSPVTAHTRVELSRRSSRSLHVLTLTPFYPSAGDDASGCFVAEALPALAEFGVESTVIAARPFYRGRTRTCESSLPAKSVRYAAWPGNMGLPVSGVSLCGRLMTHVQRLHRTRRIDLIHAHGALPCGHAANLIGRRLRIPFVVTVHGLDAYSVDQAGTLIGPLCKRISERVFRSVACVICVSEKVRQRVEAEGVVETTVVHNGADADLFTPGPGEAGPPAILSVGNLISIKGHDLLLRAIASIRDRWPHIQYEVIGDGPERRSLVALAVELGIQGRVRFLGRQSRLQVAQAMQRCTIFALPSRYEALGCVYLEAMSAAKPVIACRGQGIDEVIRHGVNGWLTSTDSVDELAAAISGLLGDSHLRRKLGAAAHRSIVDGFTLRHQAQRLTEVYRRCLA